MLAQIAGMNAADEINLETTPRELAAPNAPDSVTSEQLQSILASISSDVPRGNGSIDLNHAQTIGLALSGLLQDLDLPDACASRGIGRNRAPRYTDAGFAMAWNSYDPRSPKSNWHRISAQAGESY
jgi:hypothetical protein